MWPAVPMMNAIAPRQLDSGAPDRNQVHRIENRAQVEQETAIVDAAEDWWVGATKPLGDLVGAQVIVRDGDDLRRNLLSRKGAAADLRGGIFEREAILGAKRQSERR